MVICYHGCCECDSRTYPNPSPLFLRTIAYIMLGIYNPCNLSTWRRKTRGFLVVIACLVFLVLFVIAGENQSQNCRVHKRLPMVYGPISDLHDYVIDIFPVYTEKPLPRKPLFQLLSGPKQTPVPPLLEPPTRCQRTHEGLILVKSAGENTVARTTIRQTWGHGQNVIFLLGEDDRLKGQIQTESEAYQDILQVRVREHYWNITRKLVASFAWVNKHCTYYKYLILVDDDVLIFPTRIYKYTEVELDRSGNTFYAGNVMKNNRPHRTIFNKWHLTMEEYPYDRYPDYVTGGCVIMSRSFVSLVLDRAQFMTDLRLDDVYLGLVAHASHVTPVHVTGMVNRRVSLQEARAPHVLSSNGFHCPLLVYEMWTKVKHYK